MIIIKAITSETSYGSFIRDVVTKSFICQTMQYNVKENKFSSQNKYRLFPISVLSLLILTFLLYSVFLLRPLTFLVNSFLSPIYL